MLEDAVPTTEVQWSAGALRDRYEGGCTSAGRLRVRLTLAPVAVEDALDAHADPFDALLGNTCLKNALVDARSCELIGAMSFSKSTDDGRLSDCQRPVASSI